MVNLHELSLIPSLIQHSQFSLKSKLFWNLLQSFRNKDLTVLSMQPYNVLKSNISEPRTKLCEKVLSFNFSKKSFGEWAPGDIHVLLHSACTALLPFTLHNCHQQDTLCIEILSNMGVTRGLVMRRAVMSEQMNWPTICFYNNPSYQNYAQHVAYQHLR